MPRLISIGLLLAFLVCYFEWGNHTAFLFQIEYELVCSFSNKADSFRHPLILLPLCGQLLLLFVGISGRAHKVVMVVGIALLGVLVLMVLLAGIFGKRPWMVLSTMPFVGVAVFYFFWHNDVRGKGMKRRVQ